MTMMIKYRVSEVAKDFGVQSKEIIALLAKFSESGEELNNDRMLLA